MISYEVAYLVGAQPPPLGERDLNASLIAVASLVMMTGLVLHVVGSRFDGRRERLTRASAYHELGPLWGDIHRAVPTIALHPPRSRLAMRYAFRDIDYRLLRRIIEIRDGQRALQIHEDSAVEEVARRVGRRARLTPRNSAGSAR